MRKGETIQFKILTLLSVLALAAGCLSKTTPSDSGVQSPNNGGIDTSNHAPTIYGSPGSAVMAGDNYSFTPSASDPDNDKLSFSIQRRPAWAAFNTTTGQLVGQPSLGDIGVYENIRISVSDGKTSSALPEYSITVTDSALGSMTLSWNPPTENSDGTALTNLAGYNIYFGKTQGNYPNRIRISNPSVTTYLVENLLPATYFVVATSFNTMGVESAYSNVARKTVVAN